MVATVRKVGVDEQAFNITIQKMTGTIIDPNGDGNSRIKDNRYMVYGAVPYKVFPDAKSIKDQFELVAHQVDEMALKFFI